MNSAHLNDARGGETTPWTEEQKVHWDQYPLGDRLLFARDTRFFKRGVAAEVIAVLPDDREREIDTFATEIRFTKAPSGSSGKRRGQIEFDLGG